MSYILDALRKSEQERQAHQPETATERVLMPPPKKSRKTAGLIGALLAGNLLAVSLAAWYLKKPDEALAKPQVAAQPVQKKAASMPPTALKPVHHKTDVEPGANEAEPTLTAAPAQERKSPNMAPAGMPSPKASSIEALASVKQAGIQQAVTPAQEELKVPSDRDGQTASEQQIARIRQREQLRQKIQARRNQHRLAADNANPPEVVEQAPEKKPDVPPAATQEIPLFKELPYDFRNSAPKLSINVFKYDDKPEERFVVLNMTKYKVGQTTKDAVEIKEIRSDAVVASYGGKVFRIERP